MEDDNKQSLTPQREDVLADAVKLMAKVIDDGNKRQEKATKTSRRGAKIAATVTLLGIMITVMATNYFDRRAQEVQRIFEQSQNIQRQIERKLSVKDQLNKAIVGIRVSRDIARHSCRNNQYQNDPKDLLIELRTAFYKLVDAEYHTIGIFNKNIKNKVLHLLKVLDNDNDICKKTSLSDDELRSMENEINYLIISSIDEDENKKNKLLNSISEAPPSLIN